MAVAVHEGGGGSTGRAQHSGQEGGRRCVGSKWRTGQRACKRDSFSCDNVAEHTPQLTACLSLCPALSTHAQVECSSADEALSLFRTGVSNKVSSAAGRCQLPGGHVLLTVDACCAYGAFAALTPWFPLPTS